MKRFLKIAFFANIFFLIYLTLLPFKIVSGREQLLFNIENIIWIPFMRYGELVSLTDIAGNLLLFIPFGFLAFFYFREKGKKALVFRVTLLGFLVSLFIECVQLFFVGRVTSSHDLILNTSGSWLGAFVATVYFKFLSEKVFKWLKYFLTSEPVSLIVVLIVLLQAAGALVPFNVTITVSDLKKSLKRTNLMPFDHVPLGKQLGLSMKKRELAKKFSWHDFNENAIYFAVYGYLLMMAWFRYRKGGKHAWLVLMLFMFAVFPLIELMQFFIKSRFCDVNDVLSGWIGAGTGAAAFGIFGDRSVRAEDEPRFAEFIFPVSAYLLFLVYSGWNPFDFSMRASVLAQDLKAEYLVPFYAYFQKTSIWNIYDLFETMLAAVPLSFILRLQNLQTGERALLIKTLLFSLLLGVVIELPQVFLPDRTAEITDMLMYMAGGYGGILLYRWYKNELLPEFQSAQENTVS